MKWLESLNRASSWRCCTFRVAQPIMTINNGMSGIVARRVQPLPASCIKMTTVKIGVTMAVKTS